jgi:transposase
MLGRRNPQRSLFGTQNLPHPVPVDSFYARMGALSGVLFPDDDLATMYCLDNGRPSLPPSLMNGVLLLQFHDDVSDEEAVERLKYDLRWKVALDLSLDFAGFHPTSLTKYRNRLVENKQERYAFNRFIAIGREAGFIPDRVTLLTDTTNVQGAGAVQDTYTLLRKGIRKVLKAAGFHLPNKRQGLSPEARALLERYVDQDRKADIAWADPEQRLAQLQVLFQDAEATLDLAAEQIDDDEVRAWGWLLVKILGDDLVVDEQGQAQIGEGTAADRIISVTDPEMRHGRKSKAHLFNGFKAVVSTEQSSEMILDIADVTAAGSDGAHLMPTIERVEANAAVTVEQVLGDGAFGSGENRATCAHHPEHAIDLVAPLARPANPEVDKSAFKIDLAAQTATCPQGYTVAGRPGPEQDGLPTTKFTFLRPDCEACPLFAACVRSKVTGRTVQVGPYEAYLQQARARQQTGDFEAIYRLRAAIERKIAELVAIGLRGTRYLGQSKRQLQRLWTGAVVNLRRLFSLAEAQGVDLYAFLAGSEWRQVGGAAV